MVWHENWYYASAIISGEVIYVCSCTDMHPDGAISEVLAGQFRENFRNITAILKHAPSGFGDVVDMTSYHAGIVKIELVARIKHECVIEPSSRPGPRRAFPQ